jgi:ESS family glutamate:Na+ symporter
MVTHEFEGFVSFTFAIILLFLGKTAVSRIELLRRYSIPEPVIGGLLCAALVAHIR